MINSYEQPHTNRTLFLKIFGCELAASSGLPDGFFSNQKSKFGQILEGLTSENVDIF
jgi:hypothetical protein